MSFNSLLYELNQTKDELDEVMAKNIKLKEVLMEARKVCDHEGVYDLVDEIDKILKET